VGGGILSVYSAGGSLQSVGLGEVMVVLANVVWSWFSIAAQHWLRGCSQLRIAAVTTAAGAFALLVACGLGAAVGLYEARIDLSAGTLLLLLYAGAFPIGIGNVLWHHGVSRIGIGIASMYNNLVPVSAVLVSLIGGVAPTTGQLGGGALIVAGVLYAQLMALRAQRAALSGR
jgi:drug/metabolite transporter (DMT)-like permease